MKLELKHLVGYLPYGLKFELNLKDVQVNYKNEIRRFTMTCSNIDLCLTHGGKPILRPLSDLTKEIDGVVHLVELAKIEHPCSIYHSFTGSSVEVAGNENNSLNFRFDFDNEFFINSEFDCDDIYYPIMYQLELYEYLFKNHFDVFSLIDNNLAIDINKIENE